jgi:uncharacterized membrane protein
MPGFHFRSFLHDGSGAISVISALSLFMLLAIAALVIDTGALYFERRDQQAVTDAAALAAVQNPANATAIAADVFSRNSYQGQTLTVSAGTYTADEAVSAPGRFSPSGSDVNAVRVSASLSRQAYFAGLFGLGSPTLVTQSTAARMPTTSFGAGTRLAALNAGLLNSLLGQLWGSGVSLSLIDYQALSNTNVDALKFLTALATRASISGNYQQLANASVTTGQMLGALIDVAGSASGPGAPAALLALTSLQAQLPGAPAMVLSNVIDLAPLNGRSIGGISSIDGTGLELNLMSLLSASARTVAAGRLVNLGTVLTVPVTNSSISTRLAVGSQMAQVSAGKVGSSIRTAQIRLALTATIANVNLVVATAAVQVPIYLEAASGQATLTAMPCQRGGILTQIAATTGATSLRFGAVSDAALQNFSLPVTPVATPVVSISLLGIPIRANIAGTTNLVSSGPTTLSFTQAEIDAGTVKSAPYASATPFNTLSTNLSLSTTILGSPGLLAGALNGLLSSLLVALNPVVANLVNLMDAPVNALMTSLGLQLGIIDVRAFDARCRIPTLVG